MKKYLDNCILYIRKNVVMYTPKGYNEIREIRRSQKTRRSAMLGRPALGYQNYEEVITENILYIDKTDFIRGMVGVRR